MIHLAVMLSGLGGLLAELVWVRRFGLLLGNTSEASSMVIGFYLLGLGVGGLLVPIAGRRVGQPLRAAGAIYVTVAVVLMLLDQGLRRIEPMSALAGFSLLPVFIGIPTVMMGLAFPLVFSGLAPGGHRVAVGLVVAANLLGSLVGTALGANWWLPDFGFATSVAIAAGAYLLAGGLLLVVPVARDTEPSEAGEAASGFGAPDLSGLGPAAVAAALSGLLVVSLQLLLLRRLPFFLEGFQPTLSGVLATVLLGLTLGSAIGTGVLGRLFGPRAMAAALALAVLCMALGLQEHVVPAIAALPITTDLGLHARIWLAAAVAGGPACLLLGAVVPLGVSRFEDPATRSVAAGRLFFWQGVGSIGGSLLIGHALPALWPAGFFVATPMVVGVFVLVGLAGQLRTPVLAGGVAAVLAAGFLGISGPGTPRDPQPPLEAPTAARGQELRFLAHATDSVVTASVAYDRSRHSMVLYTNEFRATETGPFADYMKVLGHLPFLLTERLDHVAVIAFGTGTTARSVVTWPEPGLVSLVEISEAVIGMAPQFDGEGPLDAPETPAFLEDPRTRVHINDGRRFLAVQPDDSLDLVTMEPLLPYAPGTAFLYTADFYAIANRVLRPGGLLVQWVPTHALPPAYFDTLLATFDRSFEHTSVWFVDGATLLVGSMTPHLADPETLAGRLARAPEEARIALHEAGIANGADLEVALLGTRIDQVLSDAPDLRDDRPFVERVGIWKYDRSHLLFHRPNYEVLRRIAEAGTEAGWDRRAVREARMDRVAAAHHLKEASIGAAALENSREAARRLAHARRALPESVLLQVEETLAQRFTRANEMTTVGPLRAGRIARDQLERDSGSAIFVASRALATSGDAPVLEPERASAQAVALEPTFFRSPPFFLDHLPRPERERSPLEDMGHLPQGRALAEAATGDDPLGAALRGPYRVRSARALIDVLGERPLSPEEHWALRPLLDPELLRLARQAVSARGGDPTTEIDPLVRPDIAP